MENAYARGTPKFPRQSRQLWKTIRGVRRHQQPSRTPRKGEPIDMWGGFARLSSGQWQYEDHGFNLANESKENNYRTNPRSILRKPRVDIWHALFTQL